MRRIFARIVYGIALTCCCFVLTPGDEAMAQDRTAEIAEILSRHTTSYPSEQSTSTLASALSLSANANSPGTYTNSFADRERLATYASKQAEIQQQATRDHMLEIRRRIDDRSATVELARLFVEAFEAEEQALNAFTAQTYSELSPSGRASVDELRSQLTSTPTKQRRIDWEGFATEAPGAMRGILKQSISNYFLSVKNSDGGKEIIAVENTNGGVEQ